MRVTTQVEHFIRSQLEAKVARPSVIQDFNDAKNAVQQFEKGLVAKFDSIAQMEFAEFVKNNPELAGAELEISRHANRYSVAWSNSTVCTERNEAMGLRTEYVNELVQRVCIDATRCKDTKDLLELIDKVVSGR